MTRRLPRSDKVCARPGCNQVFLKRPNAKYCSDECRQAVCRANNTTLRKLYLKNYCEKCGVRGLDECQYELHHLIARADGGTDDPSNLVTLCSNCHSLQTKLERQRKLLRLPRLGLDDELYRDPYVPKSKRRKYDYTLGGDERPRDMDGRFVEWE
jgi:5-methylcytosine-specific restriction endonuclease McrA